MPKTALNDKSIRRAAPAVGQVELWDTYLPGFGLRISAGGARTYFAMRRVNGRMVRRTIGKAPPLEISPGERLGAGELWPAEARERARTVLLELARGLDAAAEQKAAQVSSDTSAQEADQRTFKAVAAAYFADKSLRGGAGLRTRSELERKVRVDLAGWADRPIDSITKEDVKTVLRSKMAADSPVAANRLLALVRRILRWAAREDMITVNPAWEIDPPARETERDRVLSLEEIALIWRASDKVGYPFGSIVKLLILTGQRRGEVAGLRWSEISASGWRLPDDRAKRGKGHLVPLSPLARTLVEDLPRLNERSGLVFTSGRAGIAGQAAAFSGWTRARERLEFLIAADRAEKSSESLDPENHRLPEWTLHDIRRSVATHLRDAAVMGGQRADRLTISKILNHAEGGMTRIYDRYSADLEKKEALDAWASRVEQLVGLNVMPLKRGTADE